MFGDFQVIDPDNLFNVLEMACYPQGLAVQQPAMQRLQDLEAVPGFIDSLIRIADSDLPPARADCRLLSVITLKNVVSRRWKTRGSNAQLLDESDKMLLKTFLLSRAIKKEKDCRVLTQLTVLMAKIAKVDWPTDWNELLPTLYNEICSDKDLPNFSSIRTNDISVYFYSVLEELSSKPIANARIQLKESLLYMFPYFSRKWSSLSFQLLNLLTISFGNDQNQNFQFLSEAGLLSIELVALTDILEIIILKTFTTLSSSGNFIEFFNVFVDHQRKYFSFFSTLSRNELAIFENCCNVYDFNTQIFSHENSFEIDKLQNHLLSESILSCNTLSFILYIRLSMILNRMCNLSFNLQKENPLHMVPFIETFLDSFENDIIKIFKPSFSINTESDVEIFDATLRLLKLPCISAILFLSDVLSCKLYTTDNNNVAKLKEKLNLRLMVAPTGAQKDDVTAQVILLFLTYFFVRNFFYGK